MSDLDYRTQFAERLATLEQSSKNAASRGDIDIIKVMLEQIQKDVSELTGLARKEAGDSFELAKKYTDDKIQELDDDVGHRLEDRERGVAWAKILIPVAIPTLLGLIALLMGQSGYEAAETAVTFQSF